MNEERRGQIVKRSETFGIGSLIQAGGLLLILVGIFLGMLIIPLALIPAGIIVCQIGGKKCYWLECSACGTHLRSDGLIYCPGCGSELINRYN